MKAKALFLAATIMITSMMAFSQQTVPEPTKTDCDKKVLKKIKRKIVASDIIDYMNEGTTTKFLVTCSVNEKNEVELERIEGGTDELRHVIIKTFQNQTIKCANEAPGSTFTFWLNLKKLPA